MKDNYESILTLNKLSRQLWKEKRHAYSGGIELTQKCNFKCVHCYLGVNKQNEEMTTKDVLTIIDKLYDYGVLFLYFTGGEIFLRQDFGEIYVYAKEKGFIVELLTNATLITDEHIKVFNQYPPVIVSASIYGMSSQTYKQITKTILFDRVIDNIKRIAKNDICVEIKYIALKGNLHDFNKAEDFANEIGAKFTFSFDIFPSFDMDGKNVSSMLDSTEIVNFEKNYERTKKVWIANAVPVKHDFNKLLYECDVATNMFLIDSKGILHPCNKLRIGDKSLLGYNFSEIWESFSYLKTIPAPKDFKCWNCLNINTCNPCPAENLLATGSCENPSKYACAIAAARMKEFSSKK